jgi:hypothetical protein
MRVHPYTLKICIPAWNHRSFFRVPKALFPKHFKFERGYRFHGTMNLAARNVFEVDLGGPFEEGSAKVPSWSELIDQGVVTASPGSEHVLEKLRRIS